MFRHFLTFALLLALAVPAAGHGSGDHIMGTVVTVGDNTLTLKAKDGSTHTVKFSSSTKFQKSGETASAADIKPGARVVVDVEKAGDAWNATLVRFGKPAAKAKGSAKPHSGHEGAKH